MLGYLSVYVTKMLEQLGDQDQVAGDLDPAIADNAMEMEMASTGVRCLMVHVTGPF